MSSKLHGLEVQFLRHSGRAAGALAGVRPGLGSWAASVDRHTARALEDLSGCLRSLPHCSLYCCLENLSASPECHAGESLHLQAVRHPMSGALPRLTLASASGGPCSRVWPPIAADWPLLERFLRESLWVWMKCLLPDARTTRTQSEAVLLG